MLLEKVREGPSNANVINIEIEWKEPKNYSGFEVRY